VSRNSKRKNVVEEQEWCRGGVGGEVSRKNMDNIEEEQEEEQCQGGVRTTSTKSRRKSAIEKQQ
jgi:hypothetical protein